MHETKRYFCWSAAGSLFCRQSKLCSNKKNSGGDALKRIWKKSLSGENRCCCCCWCWEWLCCRCGTILARREQPLILLPTHLPYPLRPRSVLPKQPPTHKRLWIASGKVVSVSQLSCLDHMSGRERVSEVGPSETCFENSRSLSLSHTHTLTRVCTQKNASASVMHIWIFEVNEYSFFWFGV